jgi:hypothetical protein
MGAAQSSNSNSVKLAQAAPTPDIPAAPTPDIPAAPTPDIPAAPTPDVLAPEAPIPEAPAPPVPKPGFISNVNHVFASPGGVIEPTLNGVAKYIKTNGMESVRYNYVSIWDDGGFRLYVVPDGTSPVIEPYPGIGTNTYHVPSAMSISTFKDISYFSIFDDDDDDDDESYFGKRGSNMMMMILLILLLVVGVLYYFHSQGKLKMPTFQQRMAQFGRTIKSLRKM